MCIHLHSTATHRHRQIYFGDCGLLSNVKDFCRVCTEFDLGNILKQVQSQALAHGGHPFMWSSHFIMQDLHFESKWSRAAPRTMSSSPLHLWQCLTHRPWVRVRPRALQLGQYWKHPESFRWKNNNHHYLLWLWVKQREEVHCQKSFGWDCKLRSPVCIRMLKDHICTIKILSSTSEIGGLWKQLK